MAKRSADSNTSERIKRTPEEQIELRLKTISSDVKRFTELITKIRNYSHPKYKLTEVQIAKISDKIDKGYADFKADFLAQSSQTSIFD